MSNADIPLTLIIFGATGNLYADKLAKALFILFQEGNALPDDFRIIAFARKDFSDTDFRVHTKESILKRSDIKNVDISELEEFVSHIEYFQGDFGEVNDFLELKNFLVSHKAYKDGQILFHLATASLLYEKIFENMKAAGLHKVAELNRPASIMIEKPFGQNEYDAKRLHEVLATLFNESQVFHVDHYLHKETARSLFHYEPEGPIEKIKVIFHESNVVGSRGATYDTVGAFRDVGENHMLELLALTIMHESRVKALSDLFIDWSKKMTRGQYAGYKEELGVNADSKTETFFRVYLKSKDERFAGVSFELEGGKGLVDMHSDITTTTVAVEVYFKDQKDFDKKEFKIQPVPGTSYDSYTKVYADAIVGDQALFVRIEEIISEWRLADELLEKWKNVPLVIYKKGTKGEEIK